MSSRERIDYDEDDDVTAVMTGEELTVAEELPARRRRLGLPIVRLPSWLGADSPLLTWIGIALALAGFVLIAIGWGQVAGETEVYLQLPYLVSAGMSGLGLIMVGVTVVNVSAKRRDALERDRQIDRLVSIMEEVRSALEERESPSAPPSRSRRSSRQ